MTATHCTTRLAHAVPLFLAAALFHTAAPLLAAQQVTAAVAEPAMHLTLPAAVDMAIAHNRKLKLTQLSVRDSEEQKRIAQSHYFPVINNLSATHHITELEGIVLPTGILSQGTSAGSIPAQTLRIDQGGSTDYISGTTLEQPLTQMFKIHAGVRAADADLNTAKIQAGDAENAVSLQVHELYYNYLIEQLTGSTDEDALRASTAAEEENQKAVLQGRLLTDVELGTRADMLEKHRAVLIAHLNLDDLTLQLDDVLGLALGTRLELDPNALGEMPVLPSRSDAIVAVQGKSPTTLAARQSVEKARAGVSAARDAYIPNITGMARYSYQSGLPFLDHNFGTFGASFTYDLFDGGAREAKLRDANIKLLMAQTQLAQTEDDVRIQISAAYDKVEQLLELVKVSQLELETREESYRIGVQRAQVNAELASGVAAAHAAATAARLHVLGSQLNLYLAQNSIKRLLGEMPR